MRVIIGFKKMYIILSKSFIGDKIIINTAVITFIANFVAAVEMRMTRGLKAEKYKTAPIVNPIIRKIRISP
jgi:hypothetical protein